MRKNNRYNAFVVVAKRSRPKESPQLRAAILQEKAKGTPDAEIGRRFGVSFRYIERVVTEAQGLNVSALNVQRRIKTFFPKDFKEERTTVWSFKHRGNWATHSGEYRGNWSPYIPRNVILKYSRPGELVLDYFCGAGTTAVEAKLLGRRFIGIDINERAIELAKRNVDFQLPATLPYIGGADGGGIYEPELRTGDARDLSFLADSSVDLICAHPPYANIIHYTADNPGDLSRLEMDRFLEEMKLVARESFRVLKPGRRCAILIGDTRKRRHIVPLGFKVINLYLDAGFRLRELVIKRQHNCKTTGFWYANSLKNNFLLLAHEYLPVFEKPVSRARLRETGVAVPRLVPVVESSLPRRRVERLETTTVWILPAEDIEGYLNRNVVARYSGNRGHLTIRLAPQKNRARVEDKSGSSRRKGLLFVKAPPEYLEGEVAITAYLRQVGEVVEEELTRVLPDGFVVLQTRDVRVEGYLEPLAKRLVELLEGKPLLLKEIVIVTDPGGEPDEDGSEKEYLRPAHQYLLVYEKK